jgi:UDP-3-O-[3-hydroxymyristoyl] glucosamine N-acyltransferase
MHTQHNIFIHETSVVESQVQIGEGSRISAFCVIGLSEWGGSDPTGTIDLGPGTRIGSHCVIYGDVQLETGVTLDPFCRVGPHATIGARTRLLYGARVHEQVQIGSDCAIQGNCPDRTTIGHHVVHLGRIAHQYTDPFADWDEPAEPGPTLESHIVIGANAVLIGPIHIGSNTFIFPGEIVRTHLPGNGMFQGGKWQHMPNWPTYLRMLKKLAWTPGFLLL